MYMLLFIVWSKFRSKAEHGKKNHDVFLEMEYTTQDWFAQLNRWIQFSIVFINYTPNVSTEIKPQMYPVKVQVRLYIMSLFLSLSLSLSLGDNS